MNYKVESVFEYVGLKCVVIMTNMGHRCGYVGIGVLLPFWTKSMIYHVNKNIKINNLHRKEILCLKN